MKITSRLPQLSRKPEALQSEVANAITGFEARGRLKEAIELSKQLEELGKIPGDSFAEMTQQARELSESGKFYKSNAGKFTVLGAFGLAGVGAGYLAHLSGRSLLVSGMAGLGGAVAAMGVLGALSGTAQGKSELGEKQLETVIAVRKSIARAPKVDLPPDPAPPEGTVAELTETSLGHIEGGQYPYLTRQKETFEKDFKWLADQGVSNLTLDQTAEHFLGLEDERARLFKKSRANFKLALGIGAAAGMASAFLGAHPAITAGVAVGSALVAGEVDLRLKKKLKARAEEIQVKGWDDKVDRLRFASTMGQERPPFSLSEIRKMIEVEAKYAKNGKELMELRDKLEPYNPWRGLANAAEDANYHLWHRDIEQLSKDWFERSKLSLVSEGLPEDAEIELGEDLVSVGDHDVTRN